MADWSEIFGVPKASPLDQFLNSLRPLPLKGGNVAPLNDAADALDRLRAHQDALATLGSPLGQGFAP